MKENLKSCAYKLREQFSHSSTHLHDHSSFYDAGYGVSLLGVDNYAWVSFLVTIAIYATVIRENGRMNEKCNRVLFVERSGELRSQEWLSA